MPLSVVKWSPVISYKSIAPPLLVSNPGEEDFRRLPLPLTLPPERPLGCLRLVSERDYIAAASGVKRPARENGLAQREATRRA